MAEDSHGKLVQPDTGRQPAEGANSISVDFPDKRAVVDLAVASIGCQGAALSTITQGQHKILASKGDGFSKLHDHEKLVESVLTTGQRLVVEPDQTGGALFVGLPLHVGGPGVMTAHDRANSTKPVGVLSIMCSRRTVLTADDSRTLANLQSILNSLLERQDVRRIAAERQSELKLTLEQMDQGITVFDADARLTLWNQRYIEMFDVDPALARKGSSLRELIGSQRHENGFEGFGTKDYDDMLSQLREGLARGETVEGGVRLNNGRVISSIHTAMPDGGWVATHSDITERVLAQERAERASLHDGMTDLANRTKFNMEFEQRNQQDGRLVIMLIDIDHFKAVNDNYGHEAGDTVIMSVAERLKSCVRSTDVVARLGGDEFAILVQLKAEANSDVAQSLADKVVKRMDEKLRFKGAVINFSISVGYCETITGQCDLESALSRADFALYKAKKDGRGRYQAFDDSNASELQRSKKMRALVKQDTYAETLTVHYQPMVCLQTAKDYCFEALIRWNGSKSEYMAPIDIIQAAEQNGSIGSLGNWVLNQALKDHQGWDGTTRIAVNVSPRQLGNSGFAAQVLAALHRWNLPPESLELEVTETALLDESASIAELRKIKELGVQIALDDFGTGYSSLTLLQHFAFDKLKIDRSFVKLVDSDTLSHEIVGSVLELGRKLKIETIAEGIETERHLAAMKSLGCNMGQGYLLGKPMPKQHVAERLLAAEKVA
ncbi:putative bifunctional diguanylate cyclase/phosphodiesterase [Hoeflea prorocentri]|uniref:EAL domain-containing protein n=1 Tax=Hoeflea prorocentri TaxID=1922333 RepID=A0A9X3UHL8_9HYPH|nr:EAL domain-containing protein [Hoeflea prorocentri]MCY6381558.1 EAL domain-containing protein [Hoeflea prorocentri]MDA5399358.1 EAL domain-containing protein [Hoeflea prorocentri]